MSAASPARIAANKANAQSSTGPRTAEGKARVSENALKHGLRSEHNPLDLATDTALPFEREEFLATLAAFMDEFAPASPFETRLVERLAQIDLRLNRAVRMETTHLEMHTSMLTRSMAGALPTGEGAEQTQHAWITTLAFLKNPSATTLIAQYESRLARDFARTLTQLRHAQLLRAKADAQIVGNQTQPEASQEIAAADLSTLPTRSPASDGRVAKGSLQEIAKQTQPYPAPALRAANDRSVDCPTPAQTKGDASSDGHIPHTLSTNSQHGRTESSVARD